MAASQTSTSAPRAPRSAAPSAARRKPAAAANPAPTPGRRTCAARPTRSTTRARCRWPRASSSTSDPAYSSDRLGIHRGGFTSGVLLMLDTGLGRLLVATLGDAAAQQTFAQLHVAPALLQPVGETGSRAELAQALNMALFRDLLTRVPEGAAYVAETTQVVFDHGALRTVAWPSGALPAGEAAITRVLRPLGYRFAEIYPLTKLKMTGRSWRHADMPEDIAQFFVSE